jgi:hypothetical protein
MELLGERDRNKLALLYGYCMHKFERQYIASVTAVPRTMPVAPFAWPVAASTAPTASSAASSTNQPIPLVVTATITSTTTAAAASMPSVANGIPQSSVIASGQGIVTSQKRPKNFRTAANAAAAIATATGAVAMATDEQPMQPKQDE